MFENRHILVFHQTSDRYYPGINNIKPGNFWALCVLLQRWGYIFLQGNHEEEPGGKGIVISFDDGYRDNFDVLMELAERDIKPLVFIPTAFTGKTNSWEYSSGFFKASHLNESEIKDLSRAGIIFGSHGHSHRALTGLDIKTLKSELLESRERIEDITGKTVNYISFPFGRTNRKINEVAQECGYKIGFIMDDPVSETGFIKPRIPVYSLDNIFSLKTRLVGNPLEKFKNRVISRLSSGTIILSGDLK